MNQRKGKTTLRAEKRDEVYIRTGFLTIGRYQVGQKNTTILKRNPTCYEGAGGRGGRTSLESLAISYSVPAWTYKGQSLKYIKKG